MVEHGAPAGNTGKDLRCTVSWRAPSALLLKDPAPVPPIGTLAPVGCLTVAQPPEHPRVTLPAYPPDELLEMADVLERLAGALRAADPAGVEDLGRPPEKEERAAARAALAEIRAQAERAKGDGRAEVRVTIAVSPALVRACQWAEQRMGALSAFAFPAPDSDWERPLRTWAEISDALLTASA